MPQTEPGNNDIKRLALATNLRQRLNRGLAAAARWLPVPLLVWASAVLGERRAWLGSGAARAMLDFTWASLALIGLWLLAILLRQRSEQEGARSLDSHYKLDDRLHNALEFVALPATKRTALMQAAIADATRRTEGLRPQAAVPWRCPRALPALLTTGALALGAYWVPPAHKGSARPPTRAAVQPSEGLVLHPEDIELLNTWAAKLTASSTSPALSEAIERYRRLLQDVSKQRVSREEVFRRLHVIETDLASQDAPTAEELQRELDARANALKQSRLMRGVADALASGDLARAQAELAKLAKQLREGTPKVSQQDLRALRRALEQAASTTAGRSERLASERRRLEREHRRLLDRRAQTQDGAATRAALQQNERQLQRLERRSKRGQQAFSQLDKELAEAASKLAEEAGPKAFEQSEQALRNLERQQLTESQKRQLKRQLEQMRKLLQEQKKAGATQRRQQLDRFRQRASGGRSLPRGGAGDAGAPRVVLSRGGAAAPHATPSQRQGANTNSAKKHGDGTDPNLTGAASAKLGKTEDVAVAGIESGDGQASSRVVYGAAQEGFVAPEYQEIHAAYETVAEEVMTHDNVPPGYRFYVRRYFQLIRPRSQDKSHP